MKSPGLCRSFATLLGCCCLLTTLAPAQTATPVDNLTLKDYRPQSIYNIPATRVERAKFPAVDMHAHDYAKTAPEVEAWVKALDEAGLRKTVVMINRSGQAFDDAAARYKKYPDRFELWAGIDYTGYTEPGWSNRVCAELERCRKAGAVGVGELSDKGRGMMGMGAPVDGWGMHLDDPRMDPVLEKCADLGLPINMHVGEDQWMYDTLDAHNDGLMNAAKWHIPEDPAVLRHDEVVATLARAARKHPRTIIVACHFANCCADLGKLAAMFDALPNLYCDISARYAETAPIPRAMAKFYEKYQDRIVYGTDMNRNAETYRTTFRILESADEHFYANNLAKYHWPLHGFALSDGILKKVYFENAGNVMARAKANAKE